MCVSVCVTPGTRLSVPGMTSASSSCARTRTRATRSKSPVTEYTSVTSGIWAMAAPVSGMRATSARMSTIAVTTSASLLAPSLLYTPRLGERAHTGGGEPAKQRGEDVRGGQRVRQRAVARLDARVEVGGERRQLVVGHFLLAEHAAGQVHGVQHLELRPGQAAGLARGGEEGNVERRVVGREHAPLREREKTGEHGGQRRRRGHHGVTDTGEHRDL